MARVENLSPAAVADGAVVNTLCATRTFATQRLWAGVYLPHGAARLSRSDMDLR
jgi:hypothetical protein